MIIGKLQNEGPEPRDMKLEIQAVLQWRVIANIKEEKLNSKNQGAF